MFKAIFLVTFLVMSAASAVAAKVDPCAMVGPDRMQPPGSRVIIQRDAALRAVIHVKRACKLIAEIESAHPQPSVALSLGIVAAKLRTRILAPIYSAHPQLCDVSATDKPPTVAMPAHGATPRRLMGPATATYLRWSFDDAERSLSKVPTKAICEAAKDEACVRPIEDLVAEISFAEAPVYASYPRLFALAMRETMRNASKRTKASDAAFRKAAPPPGSATVTPAALKVVRDYLNSLRREIGPTCEVMSFLWDLKSASKGPNDTTWKTTGPSLGLGSYSCREVPPDVIRHIGRLSIIFSGDTAARFKDKIVDRVNGTFVLREKGAAGGH